MQSISERQREVSNSIHRRRIGYFSLGSVGSEGRQAVSRYCRENVAAWREAYGPGQPEIEYSAQLDRYELNWLRPKSPLELAQERAQYDYQSAMVNQMQDSQYANLRSQQYSQMAQLASIQATAAGLSALVPAGPVSSVPEAGRHVYTRRSGRRERNGFVWLKVWIYSLISGATPFRIYWEMMHALRVQD